MTAEEIKEIRDRLGLSQRDLAQRLGVAKSTVQFWEQGRGQPKRQTEDTLKNLNE